ncbi:MAG TPA: hypothetical protein VJ739_02670, partial [Gemmataceae bacterium]|nr:hypothetical protein [Gemmataceae bacterium]
MRRTRLGLLVVVALVLLAAAAFAVLRSYLSSPAVTTRVARGLEAQYGAPVKVDRAEIGLHDSTIQGLKLYEAGASPSEPPWATVDQARADVSAWGLARGQEHPSRLTLTGASLRLRFDAAGRLLTRFPSPKGKAPILPEVEIRDSRLTIRQEGRPDLSVSGINARVATKDGHLVLTGAAQDPHWGRWDLGADYDTHSGDATGTVKSAGIHLTRPELEGLPFIGANVWEQVQAEGDTPVELTLRHDAAAGSVHYRVALEPTNTTVYVAAIDLHADQASGGVVIEDRVVRLKGVKGRTAGGVLETDGTLDFRATPDELTFHLAAEGLELKKLPKKWKLPSQLAGRLGGHADLVVTIVDGKAHTTGEGAGVITDARVAGFRADPIKIRLHSDEKGFHYSTREPAKQSRAPAALPGLALVGVGLLAAPPEAEGNREPSPILSGRTLGQLGDAAVSIPGRITDLGARLLAHVPRRLPQRSASSPEKPSSYLTANLALEDVDLAQLVKGFNLHLPVPISGRASFEVQVSFPIDTPSDLKAYRVKGSAQSPRLAVAGLELRRLRAQLHYDQGVLHLDELDGQVPSARQNETGPASAGTFHGTARMQVVPPGAVTTRLTLTDIPLDQALAIVPALAGQTGGVFSGTAQARVDTRRLRDPAAWVGSANLTSDRLQGYGLSLTDARAAVRLERGVLSAPAVSGKLEGAPVTGAADLRLMAPYRYHALAKLAGADLAALQHLARGVRPPFTTAGEITTDATAAGTLSPLTWQANGTARLQQLKVDTLEATDLRFRWDGNGDRFTVTDLRGRLYKGNLTGSAVVPVAVVDPKKAAAPAKGKGEPGRVDLDFEDVDVGALSADLFRAGATAPAVKPPFHLDGQADGTVRATLTPARAGHEPDLTTRVELHSPRLRVQGILTERLQGNVRYDKGAVHYRLTGETLGGKFQLEGQVPLKSAAPAGSAPNHPASFRPGTLPLLAQATPAGEPGGGRLRVEGAHIGRLWEQLGLRPGQVPLEGSVDIDLPFRQPSLEEAPSGVGTFTLRGLRWNGRPVAGTLRGEVRLSRQGVRLTNLNGPVGGGLLRGQVALGLGAAGRSWFNLALDNVEASRLLAPWPALASRVEGPLDISVRGTLGREWAASGQVLMARGRVVGVEVVEWRLPFDLRFAPRSGRGELAVRDTSALVALGRATGQATFTWGGAKRLDGSLRFAGIELENLLRSFGDLGQIGTGRVSGRITFGSADLRSADDLTADVQASFQQAQTMQFPVLRQVAPFLGPGMSSGSFRSGDLRARLARGIVRVQRLTLTGNTMQLFIDGTVNLAGRLGLEVTANTGQLGINPRFLRLLGLRIPAVGPIPLTLILETSSYLSNRTVHLRVTGTIRNPVVQVEPLSLLSEEAVRFFLLQAGLPLP